MRKTSLINPFLPDEAHKNKPGNLKKMREYFISQPLISIQNPRCECLLIEVVL
jgi:hypothetical protein